MQGVLLTPHCLKRLISASKVALADVLCSKQLKYPASALDKLATNCSQEKPLGWPSLNLLTPNHLSTDPSAGIFNHFHQVCCRFGEIRIKPGKFRLFIHKSSPFTACCQHRTVQWQHFQHTPATYAPLIAP